MSIEKIEIFVYLLFGIFETFIIANFFRHFFSSKKAYQKYLILSYVVRYLIISFLYLTFRSLPINVTANIILLLFLTILFDAKIKTKIMATTFFLILGVASDIFVAVVLSVVMEISMESVLRQSVVNILGIVFTKLILAMLCMLASKIINRREYPGISNWYWVTVIIIPIGSMMVILDNVITINMGLAPTSLIFTIAFIAAVNFFVFFVYDKILEEYIVKSEIQLLKKQIEYYAYQFELISVNQTVISKTKHDIKKHLLGIKLNLENGKMSEVNRALDSILGDLNLGDGPANSGNTVIDAILNYKANYASVLGIELITDLQIPFNVNFNSSDMAVILGNAIDNAIEGCRKPSPVDSAISVSIQYKKPNLHISISNPFIGNVKRNSSGAIVTTKVDSTAHGIGLKSISEIVEKYDGVMEIDVEDGIFTLNMVLSNIKQSEQKK